VTGGIKLLLQNLLCISHPSDRDARPAGFGNASLARILPGRYIFSHDIQLDQRRGRGLHGVPTRRSYLCGWSTLHRTGAHLSFIRSAARFLPAAGFLALACGGDPPLAPDAPEPVVSAVTTAVLAAPTNAAAKAGSATAITVTWADKSTGESGFEVWRSTTGPTGTFAKRATTGANVKSWKDAGLTTVTQYCYQVRAIGSSGVTPSGFSNTACATTLLKTPTNFLATASATTAILLTWTDNLKGETGFEVWRSTTGSSGSFSLLRSVPANITFANDSGLVGGTAYCYKLRALGSSTAPTSLFTAASCRSTPTLMVRLVLFGDSNTDRCEEIQPPNRISSYVSVKPRLKPTDPPLACSVPGKADSAWRSLRAEAFRVVNHAIAGTTTGGGGFGGPDRTSQGAPNARTQVNGVTRFEGEVVGTAYPWAGGEPVNAYFPGPVLRLNAFGPGAHDFAYVSMGTNDDAGATRKLTAAQTAANLRWMAQQWIAAGGTPDHFILTTLAPRNDANSPASIPDRNTLIRALATELGLHLVDLAAFVSDDNGATWRSASLNIGDGIHYTQAVRSWLGGQIAGWVSAETP
jgi:hypothetical protein